MVIPMRDCPVTGVGRRPGVVISPSALPALAAAAIPLVIDVGVKTLVDEVKRAQDNLTATYVAYGTVPLDNGKPLGEGAPTCLVVARGRFGPRDARPTTAAAVAPRGKIDVAVLDAIGALEQPSLYLEIRVMSEPDRNVRVFRPVFAQFNDTAARNPGNGTKTVGVVLAFSQKPLVVGAAPKAEDFAKADISVPFSLGPMARGTWRMGLDPSDARSAGVGDVFLDQVRVVPIRTGDGTLPETLDAYALVTESADPGFFDRLVLSTVSDKGFADVIKKAVDSLTSKAAAPAAGAK